MEINANKIFLTGATGVLGSHVLKTLLLETKALIFCLVRSENKPSAQVRLSSMLKSYGMDEDQFNLVADRISIVLGDVTEEQLGLSDSEYEDLVNHIDFSIHAAALTNLFSKMSVIESINTTGARRIIDFTLKTKTKRMCYVSTYTVLGSRIFDSEFVFTEDQLDVGQSFHFMTYQESKFKAEKLVTQAAVLGLKAVIVRPGQIFGESTTGYYPQGQTNVSGLFMDIFKTVIETGIAINSTSQFDITPVDYVSRSLVHLALEKEYFGQTFHLMNPHIRPYAETVGILQNLGYDIKLISEEEYKELLFKKKLVYKKTRESCNSSTAKAFRWWFNREGFHFSKNAIVDSTYTSAILKESGIECPKIDEKLMKTYIDHNISEGYFPEA